MSALSLTIRNAPATGTANASRIVLVNQGSGVSVATNESGTTKVAVTTTLDFLTGFDVAGSGGVASVSLDLSEDASTYRTALGLGTSATTASSAYATAAQGTTADAALPRTAAGATVTDLGPVSARTETANVATSKTIAVGTYNAFDLTMTGATTFAFSGWPTSGTLGAITLILRGSYTPTWPAAVKWSGGTAPTYTTPALYVFSSVDGGTTVLGAQVGKAFA